MKLTPPSRRPRLSLCLCAIAALLFTSCSIEENFPDRQHGEDDFLNLSFLLTETKADIGPDGTGTFSEGDRIGLFIDNGSDVQFRELTLSGGVWTPRLKRSEFGLGELTMTAHYPSLSDGSSPVADFSVHNDQNGPGKAASDLLFASTSLDKGKYDAAFTFRHLMHRIRIETGGSAENVSVSVRSMTDGDIDLLTGTVTVSGNGFGWITPYVNQDGSLEAIVLPQSAEPYRTGDGLFRIISDGKESTYLAPEKLDDGSVLSAFLSGKETTFRLEFRKDEVSEWANRTVWVYGINAPDEEDWIQCFPDMYYTYYLPWKPEYGWYDCNKINPTANPDGVPDGMMCWAATASNLMHWWITQNIEYVQKYGYTGPDYGYPLEKPQESDIFQCFIDSFEDEAGYSDEGANWFIHGIKPSYPYYDKPENHGGYFKDVFPSGVKLATSYGGLSKIRFNEIIKDALSNRKAIGFVSGNVRNSHAMTIWGAEFDSEGNVSYIYLADNNDRDMHDSFGVGCIRNEIVYVSYPEGGDNAHRKTGFIYAEPDDTIPISRLVTLDLGQEYWEEYFSQYGTD